MRNRGISGEPGPEKFEGDFSGPGYFYVCDVKKFREKFGECKGETKMAWDEKEIEKMRHAAEWLEMEFEKEWEMWGRVIEVEFSAAFWGEKILVISCIPERLFFGDGRNPGLMMEMKGED